MYKKWYFEMVVIQHQAATHLPPVLRVGWANTSGFIPYPGGGEHWGANGAGHDLYSYAFDGLNFWTGTVVSGLACDTFVYMCVCVCLHMQMHLSVCL